MSNIPNKGVGGMNPTYASMDRRVPTHPTKLWVTRGSQDKPWNNPHVVSNYIGGIIQAKQVHGQLAILRYL